jgi:hypothetical protein
LLKLIKINNPDVNIKIKIMKCLNGYLWEKKS